ncbi:hypothetical protein ABWU59_29275 [Priestia megaterium]
MPHKMTLTGSATGPLREYDRYVAFDMREKEHLYFVYRVCCQKSL